ncbi:hypothetical protein AC578_4263 [Pseudocercospora eumusae]|uniref:Uncharacterized protein n=1 Tax=Pseudocercospora eumusae TaxID=321146 RepID=A0A139HAQ3_9PEZI|nr:hypothetical protein AC578_4263 [Pseudocercospora eumusae]
MPAGRVLFDDSDIAMNLMALEMNEAEDEDTRSSVTKHAARVGPPQRFTWFTLIPGWSCAMLIELLHQNELQTPSYHMPKRPQGFPSIDQNPRIGQKRSLKQIIFPKRGPQTQPAPQPEDDDYTGNEYCLFLSCTVLECLRAAPSNELQKASAKIGACGTWRAWMFLPVIDGDLRSSREISTDAELEAWLRLEYPLLTARDVNDILEVHCTPSDASGVVPFATGPQQRPIALYSESTFVCSSYWLAEPYSCGKSRAARRGLILSPAFVQAFGRVWSNLVVNNDPSREQEWPTFNEHVYRT